MNEQRNSYKGQPPRPWLRLEFLAPDGVTLAAEMLADTGSPPAFILKPELFDRLVTRYTRQIDTNFGPMQGGWVRLYTRALGLVETVEAFRSEKSAQTAARSHPDFVGVVGLPVLRLAEYGGNADEFWIRTP